MRFLLKASMSVEAGNALVRDGILGEKIHSILGDTKPEAVYFTAMDGRRTALIFVDIEELSQIPGIAEPWMLAVDASIEFYPLMVPEDLEKAEPDFKRAVEKYG